MKIKIIAVGTKMPAWVTDAWSTYHRRLPRDWRVELIEIPASKRQSSQTTERAAIEEGDKIIKKTAGCYPIVALDRIGKVIHSHALANHLQQWQNQSDSPALLIGGPEGLSQACLDHCHQQWSLSALTLPHPLVRVLLIEQLFRAWTIQTGHPYHR